MAMDALLPSEIARMVYGYLLEERCTEAARLFLGESQNLNECRQVLSVGKHFSTRVCGLTLLDVLEKFCLLNTIVQEKLENFDKLDKLRHCNNLESQIKVLFEEYKGKNFIPTVNTATQSTPSLHGSPSKFRRRRIFSNKEDDKTKRIDQEFTEESQGHNTLDQFPSKSVEATPLKNLPGYLGEFEADKHKKLNSKTPEQNLFKSTAQKDTVIHNAHLQKVQKGNQNIQLQETQKDEILIKKRCPNINKDLNFQTENLIKHIDSAVQTELCSVTVFDKNIMTEMEQKTYADTGVQTSDIGSPESELEVIEILTGTDNLINRTEVVEKIADNSNIMLAIKSNLLEKSNDDAKEACTKSFIVEYHKAIEAAANKSENNPQIIELFNAIILPPEDHLTENKVNLDIQCGVTCSSSQEQLNSILEETVSEKSIEKDVIVVSNNVNKHKILKSKNSDKSKSTVHLKNSANLEIDNSKQSVDQVDAKIMNIFTSSADINQVVSHNSQITTDKENDMRHNTETLLNSVDSSHLQKKSTNNSDNIFTQNNTVTSTPIKTFTAIENFDTCDWFSAQDIHMSNVASYKDEISKCVSTTTPGIYTSTEAIVTNTHFLSPITSKDTNKIVEKINFTLANTVKDQTLHTPDTLFPPKISTAVTVNSDSCPTNSAQRNKTPTLQKTSEIIDQLLDIQSAQKLDKNLDNISSELKDNNSNDCNKYFNVDSIMFFGVDSTISSIPMPMHVQEIEIEDSITLTGTGLSPFLKVIKKCDDTETSSVRESEKAADSEISKPHVLCAVSDNERIENISESKMTENTKYTPAKVIENRPKTTRKSLSTPKKPNSYIRALNFDTPINRSQSESKVVDNTDSCLSPDSLKRSFKNACKSSLFQSPSFTNSESVEQKKNTKILPTIPESTEPAAPESKALKRDANLPKKEFTVKPAVTEQKSWDSELRKYLGKNEDENSSKKRSKSELSRKSYKKAKKDDKDIPKREKKSYKKSSRKSNKDEKLNNDDKKKEDIKLDKKKEEIKVDKKKEDIKVDKRKEEIKSDKRKEDIKTDMKKLETKTDKKKENIKADKIKEDNKADKRKADKRKADRKKEDIKAKKEEVKVDEKKENMKADKEKEEIKPNKSKDIEAIKKEEEIKADKKKETETDKNKERIKLIKDDKETSGKIKIVKKTIVSSSKESTKKEETKEVREKNRESKSKVSNVKKEDDPKEKKEKQIIELKKHENEKIEQNGKVIEEKRIEYVAKINHNNNKKELENLKETSTECKSKNVNKKDSVHSYSINKENTEDNSAKQKKDPLVVLLSDSINDDNDEIQNIEKLASEEMANLSKFNNETINGPPKESNNAVNIQDDEMTEVFENISNKLTTKIISEENAIAIDNHAKDIAESPLKKKDSVDYAKLEEELSLITNAEDPKSVKEVIYDEVSKVERGKIVQKKYARLKTLETKVLVLNEPMMLNDFDFEIPSKDEDSLQVPPTPQVLSPGSSLILPLSKISEDSRTFPSLIATPLECPKTPNIVLTPMKGQTEHTSDVPQKTESYRPAIVNSESTRKPEITQFEVIKENLIKSTKMIMETDTKNKDNLGKIEAPMSYREKQRDITSESNDNSSSSASITVSNCSCEICCSATTSESKENEKVEEDDDNSVNDSNSDEEEEDEDGDDDEEEEAEDEEDEHEKERNKQDQAVIMTEETSPAKVFSIKKNDKELAGTMQETPVKDSSCTEVEIFDTPIVSKLVEQPTNLSTKISQMMILKDQDNKVVQIKPKPKIISVKRVLPKVITKPPTQLIKALPKSSQLQALEVKNESITLPPLSQRLKIKKSEEEVAQAIKSIENHKFNKSQDELILLSATPSPANQIIDKNIFNKSELAHAIESLTRNETDTIELFGNDKRAIGADDDCNRDANVQLVLKDNCEKDEDNSNGTEHEGNAQDVERESIMNNSHSHNTRFQSQRRRKEKERTMLSNSIEPCLEIRYVFDEEKYKRKRRKAFSVSDLYRIIAEGQYVCISEATQMELLLDIKPKRKKPVRRAQVKKEKYPKLDENSHDSMPDKYSQMLNNDSESLPDELANVANDEATCKHKRPLDEGEASNRQVVKKRKKNIFIY